jgi:hypothetical protein
MRVDVPDHVLDGPDHRHSGIAIEIAQAKKIPADEFFKTLASLPRDKVQERIGQG